MIIQVPVPNNFEDHCFVDAKYFCQYLSVLEKAFDLRVDDGDPWTSYLSHDIIDAYLNTDGSVTLTYDITTDTYYGCRDIDSQDTITRSIVGERVDGKWEFKQSIYCEPRSTFEEF